MGARYDKILRQSSCRAARRRYSDHRGDLWRGSQCGFDAGRAALAASLLRHHLDRPALLSELRAGPDHAQGAGRAEAGGFQIYRPLGAILLPLGRGAHRADRAADRLARGLSRAGADAGGAFPPHRHRHVAGADHGVQRLVRDLAEPEEGARHRAGRRCGQGQGRDHRDDLQPHQHLAVARDALLHGEFQRG